MAENPIAGALANLGQTFSNIGARRLESQRLDLLGQRQEAEQIRSLEALKLQGQAQVAEQELAMVREQAAIRQQTRELGFKERETTSLEKLRGIQGDVALGGLKVQQQQAADTAAFHRGQLANQSRQVAVQEAQEQRQEKVFNLGAEDRRITTEILRNQLKTSNNTLAEQERKLKLWNTEFSIADIQNIFRSQGVPEANIKTATLGLETIKRAIHGVDTNVSDKITLGDATIYGAAVTEAMKLVQTGKDNEAINTFVDVIKKGVGPETPLEQVIQIAQEAYLAVKDPRGSEQRFLLGDYTRSRDRAVDAALRQRGLDPATVPADKRAIVVLEVERALQEDYKRSGKPLPAGVQPLTTAAPAATGQPQAAPGAPADPGALTPAVTPPGVAAPAAPLPPLPAALAAEVASGQTSEAIAQALWQRALANTGGDVARATETIRLRGKGREELGKRPDIRDIGPTEMRNFFGIPQPAQPAPVAPVPPGSVLAPVVQPPASEEVVPAPQGGQFAPLRPPSSAPVVIPPAPSGVLAPVAAPAPAPAQLPEVFTTGGGMSAPVPPPASPGRALAPAATAVAPPSATLPGLPVEVPAPATAPAQPAPVPAAATALPVALPEAGGVPLSQAGPAAPQTLRTLPGGVPLRQPYPSEDAFFRSRPDVAGMAAEDGSVILNPYSRLSHQEQEAVALNEAARVVMRTRTDLRPDFRLTPEQEAAFGRYGTAEEAQATVAARILSGDPSAGTPTAEQLAFVRRLASVMGLRTPETATPTPAPAGVLAPVTSGGF